MTTFGKSIRIYLKDGTVTGLKLGEVVNHTIQSISCPRFRISELNDHPESKRPGVYFLFGHDEETEDLKAYIGEAENVYDRLQYHITRKEFWNEVVFFVSKDENLTKSHVKYLESRLIQIALSTKRYKIDNTNQSQQSLLPLADRDAMEEFLVYIKLLVGVLGHKLLEDVLSRAKVEQSMSLTATTLNNQVVSVTRNLELFLSVSGLKATALQTDEGLVVLEGSEATKEIQTSLPNGYKEMRDKLVNNRTLVEEGTRYIFKKNALFSTSTPAAAVIVGYNVSGPQTWKSKDGKTLKTIEEDRVKTATANPPID